MEIEYNDLSISDLKSILNQEMCEVFSSEATCQQHHEIGVRRIAVLAASLVAIAVSGAFSQSRDTLNVLHTSDLHVMYNVDECHPLLPIRHFVVKGCIDSVERFFATIPRQMKADAVVVTGDILDMFEGETRSHQVLGRQIEQFRSLYEKCQVPLFLTLGNHDLTTYVVHDRDSSIVETQTSAERARASWIRSIPCFYDGTFYRRAFQVGTTKYHLIFLDNGYSLHDGGRIIDKAQLDWLQEQLTLAGADPVVLFFHIYFSVGDMNGDGMSFKENGPLHWPTATQCSDGLLKVLNEHPKIKAMVVGHGHSNVLEGIRFPGGHMIYQIETGSVTEGAANWRLLQCTEHDIVVSHPGTRTPELRIALNEKGK